MAKCMLIDASHPEETRVVVLSGNRLENFDYESASKKQLKGNIYLAKITRVEPSLQAAFVEYGGNRHGFLPFSEIHPDYYRIPIADRKALLAAEAKLKSESAEDEPIEVEPAEDEPAEEEPVEDEDAPDAESEASDARAEAADAAAEDIDNGKGNGEVEEVASETGVDTVGGDDVDDAARRRARLLRKYKIQEVIKRRQVILVQVTKEERGNKGAALTSYLSLAGRYCVLMPNTGKGGGISRKISNPSDRRRLKKVVENLDIPEGVAVIVRTAGSERTKVEIKRDYEYLLRLWGEIRDTTLASTAPSLIYEEANLIKRAMRDLYQSDMDEIHVEGDEGYKHAKAFMKSLMPSHARKVKLYKDATVPLLYRYQVEDQIDAMHNATVQLKSGGYIVINMTEALVAIDVNSGRATRERHIEGTAYKTNLEAAEEIARQQRLRDLAGLIVIDFIDMEESRHNRAVERKLKEAMRLDRARIQLGRISPFGLLEMSRQRLRPSLFESSTVVCPNCNASGFVRTTESMALHVLRGLEEEGIRRGAGEVLVTAPPAAALHLLNRMRDRMVEIEQRYGFRVRVEIDESLIPPNYTLERLRQAPAAGVEEERRERPTERGERDRGEKSEAEKTERKRTRGRRRRRRGEEPAEAEATETVEAAGPDDAEAEERAEERAPETAGEAVAETAESAAGGAAEEDGEDKPKRRRRRGKRGGRRRSRRRDEETTEAVAPESESEDLSAATESQDEATEAPAEAAGPTEAEAPKPKRRRATRKKKAAPAEPAAEAEETPAEADAAADAEPKAEAKPKRKRSAPKTKRAPRKKAAAKKKAPPDAEAAAPEAPAPEAAAEPAPPAPSTPEPAEPPEPLAAAPSEAAAAEEPAAPRRRGWWQKFS